MTEKTPLTQGSYNIPGQRYYILGRHVISKSGNPTEKGSNFLRSPFETSHAKQLLIHQGFRRLCKKDKTKKNLPENSKLIAADVVGLYPGIWHQLSLKILEEALEKRESKQIPTDNLIKLAKFVLQNNYFKSNGEEKQQILGTAVGTKFAPPYVCIFIDQVESEFLKNSRAVVISVVLLHR